MDFKAQTARFQAPEALLPLLRPLAGGGRRGAPAAATRVPGPAPTAALHSGRGPAERRGEEPGPLPGRAVAGALRPGGLQRLWLRGGQSSEGAGAGEGWRLPAQKGRRGDPEVLAEAAATRKCGS